MGTGYKEKLVPGDIVGGLEIIKYSHTDSGGNRWLDIQCFCGKVFKASAWRIKVKHTKSCGCLIKRICSLRNVNVPYKERCKRMKKGWETRRLNIIKGA